MHEQLINKLSSPYATNLPAPNFDLGFATVLCVSPFSFFLYFFLYIDITLSMELLISHAEVEVNTFMQKFCWICSIVLNDKDNPPHAQLPLNHN